MKKLRIYFENVQQQMRITYNLKLLVRRAVQATLKAEGIGKPAEVTTLENGCLIFARISNLGFVL